MDPSRRARRTGGTCRYASTSMTDALLTFASVQEESPLTHNGIYARTRLVPSGFAVASLWAGASAHDPSG
jgi:hypothetical protein